MSDDRETLLLYAERMVKGAEFLMQIIKIRDLLGISHVEKTRRFVGVKLSSAKLILRVVHQLDKNLLYINGEALLLAVERDVERLHKNALRD